MKASLFEGGLRGAAFIAGAGLAPSVRGTVSQEFYSLVDWLPTLAGGVAGIDLARAALPKHAYQPPPPPLDGMDILTSLTTGAPSPRTSALLYLDPFSCFTAPSPCAIPGQGAIRVGRYKLLHGHVAQYMSATNNVSGAFCGARDGVAQGSTVPLPVPPAHTPSFCPAGWVNPPGSATLPPVEPPPGAPPACAALPPQGGCRLDPADPLLAGGTWLYDVVADPTERVDLAPTHPELVAQLLAALAAFNASAPPQAHSAQDPAAAPARHGGFWTPWRGNPTPSVCDPNTTAPGPPPPSDNLHSALDGLVLPAAAGGVLGVRGWAWSAADGAGGRAHLNVTLRMSNGVGELGSAPCVLLRPQLVNATGAPDNFHGFMLNISDAAVIARVLAPGRAVLSGSALVAGQAVELQQQRCYDKGVEQKC